MEFEDIIRRASTQYGYERGTASIDWDDLKDIHELAHDHGVPAGFFPIGLSLFGSDPDLLPLTITIYAVDEREAGSTGEQIKAFAEKHGEGKPLPVHAFRLQIDLNELKEYIKRVHIVLTSQDIVGDVPLGIVLHVG